MRRRLAWCRRCRCRSNRKWTAGELNPDFLGANQVSYRVGPAAHFFPASPQRQQGFAFPLLALRASNSSRGGSRTHKQSPDSESGRFAGFAYSAIFRQYRELESNQLSSAYEADEMPFLHPGRSHSCGGRIRTGVVRLMRPSWNQAPVHSAVVSAGFEPASSTMSRWRALRAAPRDHLLFV